MTMERRCEHNDKRISFYIEYENSRNNTKETVCNICTTRPNSPWSGWLCVGCGSIVPFIDWHYTYTVENAGSNGDIASCQPYGVCRTCRRLHPNKGDKLKMEQNIPVKIRIICGCGLPLADIENTSEMFRGGLSQLSRQYYNIDLKYTRLLNYDTHPTDPNDCPLVVCSRPDCHRRIFIRGRGLCSMHYRGGRGVRANKNIIIDHLLDTVSEISRDPASVIADYVIGTRPTPPHTPPPTSQDA